MRFWLLFLFQTALLTVNAQTKKEISLEQIESASIEHTYEEKEMKGIFKLYQKHVSEQIISDCIYEHSCSHFSQGAIKTFGLFKGVLMTVDRLTRCSRTSFAETPRVRINKEGKIIDHWNDYKKRS